MPFVLEHLDGHTRSFMLEELDFDEHTGAGPFLSPRLTLDGRALYPRLLRVAIEEGGMTSLEHALLAPGILQRFEVGRRGMRTFRKNVPANAAQIIAEGEFNRYYIRGLCLRVLADGARQVQVYRARESSRARPQSEAKIGLLLSAEDLLEDLRASIGGEPAVLPEINSGLSVRIP